MRPVAGGGARRDIFVLASETRGTSYEFTDPDGLRADPDGRIFIETDGGQPSGNNQMLVADSSTGEIRRLFARIDGDEITGLTVTPDRCTMFANTQHPGNGDPARTNFPVVNGRHHAPWRDTGNVMGGVGISMSDEASSAMPLVGREAEAALISGALDRLVDGEGGALLLEGPAGIGKTSVLDAAHAEARTRGVEIAYAGADEASARRPFHVALAVASSLSTFEGAEVGPREELRALLESARPTTSSVGSVAPGAARVHIIEAIIAELEQRTRSPFVLVVDDLQFADDASLAAMRAILQLTRQNPLLILATSRGGARTAERELRDEFAETGQILELGPLDSAAITQLATELLGAPPSDDLLQVLDTASGNPLLVGELLRTLALQGKLSSRLSAIAVEPGTHLHALDDLVELRIAGLDAQAMHVLRCAAVLGASSTIEEIAAVIDARPLDLVPPVDAALVSGTLIDDGGRLRFVHDLIRDAVYQAIPVGIRSTMHRHAAEVLAAADAPSVLIARHAALSAAPEEAVRWLTMAAEDVMSLAPETALEMLDEAGLLSGGDESVQQAIQRARVESLLGVGRLDEAIRLADQLRDAMPAGDARADLLVRIGGMLIVANRAGEASEQLALAAAETTRTTVRALALAQNALARTAIADLDTADSLARDAVALGDAVGSVPAQVLAECVLARIPCFTHGYRDGRLHAERAVEVAEYDADGAGDDYLPWFWLGVIALDLDDHDTVAWAIAEGRRRAARYQAAWADPLYAGLSASLHHRRGELDQAIAEAETGVSLSIETGSTPALLWCQSIAALAANRRGDTAAQRQWVEAAEETWAREGALLGIDHFVIACSLELPSAEAATRLAEARDFFVGMGMDNCTPLLAVPLLRAGGSDDAERARAIVGDLTDAGARHDVFGIAATALHAAGLVDTDVDGLIAAAEAFAALGRRLDEAEALADAARVAHQARDPRAGGIHARATEAFEACDADPVACLADLDLAPAESSGSHDGWDSLTATERSVVGLVGEGLTNSEIAELRHVSRRTIESHLLHVYTKLGFSSRTRLAVEASERLGPLAHDDH